MMDYDIVSSNGEHMSQNDSKVQWQPIIELSIVLFTILGSTIPLYLHTDAKIDAIHHTVDAIREDMRDFHGRMCAIEERNKGK